MTDVEKNLTVAEALADAPRKEKGSGFYQGHHLEAITSDLVVNIQSE